jgi:CubicO group peptidase (beta-lactamase class C family)
MARNVILLQSCLSLLRSQTGPLSGLDEYIAQAMQTFDVPGVAVAVVHNGAVKLTKGYGVRRMANRRASMHIPSSASHRIPKPSPPRRWRFWWTKAN